jgi:hypothetical protein
MKNQSTQRSRQKMQEDGEDGLCRLPFSLPLLLCINTYKSARFLLSLPICYSPCLWPLIIFTEPFFASTLSFFSFFLYRVLCLACSSFVISSAILRKCTLAMLKVYVVKRTRMQDRKIVYTRRKHTKMFLLTTFCQ